MFGRTKKIAATGECPKCSTAPIDAKHCPRCGRPVGGFICVVLSSKEVRATIKNREWIIGTSIVGLRLSSLAHDHVKGTWRIEKEVRRELQLKMGQATEWELTEDVSYRRDELGSEERQKPMKVVYRMRLVDVALSCREAIFLVEKLGFFKKKLGLKP